MRASLCNWQKTLAQGFTTAADLLQFLSIDVNLVPNIVEQPFKTRVPVGFARRMQPGNLEDPLLLQVLATKAEEAIQADYVLDPLDEVTANKLPGLIHKYHGRVLLTLTGACAVNCRYCFRRHFPYRTNNPGKLGWADVVDYIARDSSIQEVILSGGDPLLASDTILSDLLQSLERIAHLRTLRIHTRIPIVLPERIDAGFVELLNSVKLNKVIVLHSNHANEIDDAVANACMKLKATNCTLLNQSVLLQGINDDALVLARLSERLFSIGVLPYYLHILDKVLGAQHFAVDVHRIKALYNELQSLLPGYLVPRLAAEHPSVPHKTIYGAQLC